MCIVCCVLSLTVWCVSLCVADITGHIGILRWLLECTDATGEELDNYGGTLAHDAAEQGQLG